MKLSTKKIEISSVTAGKPCRISVNDRNVRRPGKFIRDSAYPAIDDTVSTRTVMKIAMANVFSVIGHTLSIDSIRSVRNFQLPSVNPPRGFRRSVRYEKVARMSHV